MCTTRNASASSETLRCSESSRKRGQRAVLQRRTSRTPRTIASVSSSSATAPVERVRYQYASARRRPAEAHAAERLCVCRRSGHPPTAVTSPARRPAARAVRVRPASAGAAPERIIAAVEAMFASVQLAAATLTVLQVSCTGAPVSGSMMWCIVRPAWLQRRTEVLDVARPPERIETVWPGRRAVAAVIVGHATCQPPSGASPVVAMSPPMLTSTPHPRCSARQRRRGRRPTLWRSRPRSRS